MRGGMTKEEIKNNREKEKEMILNELRKIKQHDPNELDNYKYWKYINNKTTQIIKDKYRYNRNLNGVNDPNYSRFANVRFLEDPDRIGYLVYDTIKGTIGTNFTKDKYINKEDLEFIWPWDDEDYFPSYEEFMSEVSNPEQYTPESTEPVDQSINVELTDEEIKEEREKREEMKKTLCSSMMCLKKIKNKYILNTIPLIYKNVISLCRLCQPWFNRFNECRQQLLFEFLYANIITYV